MFISTSFACFLSSVLNSKSKFNIFFIVSGDLLSSCVYGIHFIYRASFVLSFLRME